MGAARDVSGVKQIQIDRRLITARMSLVPATTPPDRRVTRSGRAAPADSTTVDRAGTRAGRDRGMQHPQPGAVLLVHQRHRYADRLTPLNHMGRRKMIVVIVEDVAVEFVKMVAWHGISLERGVAQCAREG